MIARMELLILIVIVGSCVCRLMKEVVGEVFSRGLKLRSAAERQSALDQPLTSPEFELVAQIAASLLSSVTSTHG